MLRSTLHINNPILIILTLHTRLVLTRTVAHFEYLVRLEPDDRFTYKQMMPDYHKQLDMVLFFKIQYLQGGGSAPSSSGGWAKGTGYGGPGSFYNMGGPQRDDNEQKSREAAALRQQVVDSHLQRSITDVCNCLERATGAFTKSSHKACSHAAAAAAAASCLHLLSTLASLRFANAQLGVACTTGSKHCFVYIYL